MISKSWRLSNKKYQNLHLRTQKQTIATESSKFLNKKEDIKTLLTDSRCESSSEILKNRELDPELKTSLASLETKVRDLEGTMNALEVGVLEEMKRNRIQEDE
ncbi:hypothetical protein RMCBS344292_01194 [Rhizopus microsporus]|nr:hypothetical protein RMCBS344292_01194 [Rhizopus microsporus]